jgi:hypothetical protein
MCREEQQLGKAGGEPSLRCNSELSFHIKKISFLEIAQLKQLLTMVLVLVSTLITTQLLTAITCHSLLILNTIQLKMTGPLTGPEGMTTYV